MCCFATFLVATRNPPPSGGEPKKRNYFIVQVVELVPAH